MCDNNYGPIDNASLAADDSKSMCDKINDLALASLDLRSWGVRLHNDHLWDQVHNITIAHSPLAGTRPDNKFASIGFVADLMVDEVHSELAEQGLV